MGKANCSAARVAQLQSWLPQQPLDLQSMELILCFMHCESLDLHRSCNKLLKLHNLPRQIRTLSLQHPAALNTVSPVVAPCRW